MYGTGAPLRYLAYSIQVRKGNGTALLPTETATVRSPNCGCHRGPRGLVTQGVSSPSLTLEFFLELAVAFPLTLYFTPAVTIFLFVVAGP